MRGYVYTCWLICTLASFYCLLTGTSPLQKKLKKTAVPHIFQWTRAISEGVRRRDSRYRQREMTRTEKTVEVINAVIYK